MLNFNSDTHVYTLDGQVLPSVTTILKSEGFIDTTFYNEWARNKGSMVHLACHLDDTGELDESTVDPIITPYLEAYGSFKSDSGFVVSSSETPLASPVYRFAGTPDKMGSFKDVTCAILDIKTGTVEPWAAIQLAAYEILVGSPYKRFALQLMDSGKYKLHPFTERSDRNIFLSALSIYQWKKNNLKKG